MHNAIGVACVNMLNNKVAGLTAAIGVARTNALFTNANVNALFELLQRFTFGPFLQQPAGWQGVTAQRLEPAMAGLRGQFDRLRIQTTAANQTLRSRMAQDRFNPPFNAAMTPQYPAFAGPGGPAQQRVFYRKQLLSVLTRTLNRLVNEEVQRRFVMPNAVAAVRAEAAPVFGAAGVTRGEVARGFLHMSQRSYWAPRMQNASLHAANNFGVASSVIDERRTFLQAQWDAWVVSLNL